MPRCRGRGGLVRGSRAGGSSSSTARSRLGNECLAVQEQHALAVSHDPERAFERWREPQRDLDRRRIDESRQPAGRVAAVSGRQRAPVATPDGEFANVFAWPMFSPESRKPVRSVWMRLALAQINAVVGDLDGNRERILAALEEARAQEAELVLFPELAVTGYPPRTCCSGPRSCGPPRSRCRRSRRPHGDHCARRHALVRPRSLQRVRRLHRRRDPRALPEAPPAELRRLRRGPLLRARPRARPAASSADADRPDRLRGHLAARPPATDLALEGAELLVNISASPYHVGKAETARRCW